MPFSRTAGLVTVFTTLIAPVAARAQSAGGMDHAAHHAVMTGTAPTMPSGQDAFAAISAVIATLEADSTTDWSKVNIEALRQHLIAMNDVTLGARSTQTAIPGGARMDVTGQGRVAESIRGMLHAHAHELEAMGGYRARVEDIPGGARLTVTASDASDARAVDRVRALGFIGLLTEGAHHDAHHLAIARGTPMTHR